MRVDPVELYFYKWLIYLTNGCPRAEESKISYFFRDNIAVFD